MNVTWSALRAVEALLEECVLALPCYDNLLHNDSIRLCFPRNLQIRPDIDITTGNLRGTEENVPAIAACTSHFKRVLATMSGGAVKSDTTALIAVWSVYGEGRLIPSALEIGRDLCKREREENERENSVSAEHRRKQIQRGNRD